MATMSNAAKARHLARVIAVMMQRAGVTEIKIPVKELENLPALGYAMDDDMLVVALGDKP